MDRSNVLATISDLERWLKDVDEQKREVESTIITLKRLLGIVDGGYGIGSIPPNRHGASTTSMSMSRGTPEGPIPSDRVHAALREMSGRFTRSELYERAENDGNGEIAKGTFASIFSKLMQRGFITLVEGKFGNRTAVYMRTEEYNAQKQNPTPEPDTTPEQGDNLFQG